ncbi:MAG: phosphatase PAP2 family protein [Acidimicrobiales bacterium]
MPWTVAAPLAGGTAAAWAATSGGRAPPVAAVRPWLRELTVMLGLYALWQYAGRFSLGQAAAATGRGRSIWRTERSWHVPSEAWLQHLVLGHHAVLLAANLYYGVMHVAALGALLVWSFVRHRDRYPAVRNAVASVTAACLVIQLWPVAPPRLVAGLGVVDTGRLVGPSVYGAGAGATGGAGIDQLSAMPSVHLAWALVVGVAVVALSRHRWRGWALAHPLVTLWVIVVTGNHYWADAAVAAVLCAPAIWATGLCRPPPLRGPGLLRGTGRSSPVRWLDRPSSSPPGP